MRAINYSHVTKRLTRVQRRFEVWRRNRPRRTRIPEPLWQDAVELALSLGIHHVAASLRLDYYSLRARVHLRDATCDPEPDSRLPGPHSPPQTTTSRHTRRNPSTPALSTRRSNPAGRAMVARPNSHASSAADACDAHLLPTFVELVPPMTAVPRQCLIEFETGQGTRLRVQLSGSPLADVIALSRGLCFGDACCSQLPREIES
jgi:hypothetical protein